MNITEEMVERLNKEVAERGCSFRFEYQSDKKVPIPGFYVVLPSMNCINSYTLNLSEDFINWLSLWFKITTILFFIATIREAHSGLKIIMSPQKHMSSSRSRYQAGILLQNRILIPITLDFR